MDWAMAIPRILILPQKTTVEKKVEVQNVIELEEEIKEEVRIIIEGEVIIEDRINLKVLKEADSIIKRKDQAKVFQEIRKENLAIDNQ